MPSRRTREARGDYGERLRDSQREGAYYNFRPYRDVDLKDVLDVSYSSLHRSDRETGELFAPSYLGYSDYSGSTVERSNVRVFERLFGKLQGKQWWLATGDADTTQVVIRADTRHKQILEVLDGLENYPLIDEMDHSELEHEGEVEAWESWLKSDYSSMLETQYSDEGLDLDDVNDDALWEVFHRVFEDANAEWVSGTGGGMTVRPLERIVEQTSLDALLAAGARAFADEDDVASLRAAAEEEGDSKLVRLCDRALDGDEDALRECGQIVYQRKAGAVDERTVGMPWRNPRGGKSPSCLICRDLAETHQQFLPRMGRLEEAIRKHFGPQYRWKPDYTLIDHKSHELIYQFVASKRKGQIAPDKVIVTITYSKLVDQLVMIVEVTDGEEIFGRYVASDVPLEDITDAELMIGLAARELVDR